MPRASHLFVTPTISLKLSYNGLEIFVACEQCFKGYRGKSRASATCARARTRAALLARSLSVRFARCSKWKVTSGDEFVSIRLCPAHEYLF